MQIHLLTYLLTSRRCRLSDATLEEHTFLRSQLLKFGSDDKTDLCVQRTQSSC